MIFYILSEQKQKTMEKKYQYEYPHFAVTVDNVILNLKDPMNPKVLLITRKNDPYQGKLALPGGFLDPKDRTGMSGAIRELREETNLELSFLYQTCTLTRDRRDPRERCISIVYAGVVYDDFESIIKGQDDASDAKWVPLIGMKKNELAFDHANAIWKSISELFSDEANLISLFNIKESEYHHVKMLLDTINFNLGSTCFPIL